MRKKMGLCLLTLLTLTVAVPLPANATAPDQPGGKVADHPAARGTGGDRTEPAVHAALARGEEPAVLIRFKGKADLSRAFGIADRDARATWVYETLRDFAARAQTEARETLRSRFGLSAETHDYTVLWIDNAIAVARLGPALLASLESVAEIDSIRLQREIPLPVTEKVEIPPRQPDAAESSLVQMRVPDVWALGYKGSGLVVANIDSGVRHTHNALVNQYRGRQSGGAFVHDYNWYDPYNHSATPRTTHDHGTHTMGTMVGFDGGANQIGAAPEAKWMACIGFGQTGAGATDAGLLECGQWVLAPYPTSGSGSPNPALHADVVNNSWGDCGRSYDDWYEGVIDAWIAAGIAPLFSNGNNSNCSYPINPPLNTVGNPARSGKVLGIGSTGRNNGAYATHSNKGPTDDPNPGLPTYPAPLGFPYLKPNVVAPGVDIRSAYANGDAAYGGMTGTSMSAPNAAGVVALIWDAAACLKGDFAITGTILMQTARAIPVNTGSPHDGPGNVPNQATGWGEVDALSAVNAAIAYCSGGGFAPLVSKAFAPTPIVAGATSTLTIRLENLNATDATLTAALTDTFPAGIVTAAAPNATTTCGSGSVSTTAGSVTLASGAVIPASGSCTVRVDVTGAVDGSYLNTIPAGALQTDQGANAKAASAKLKVGLTFPEPYPPVTFPSGVEPITKVTFAGIDNTTSPTSSIPLEDFTAISGNVLPGSTYLISVQGNTMGSYTTYVNAFVDWNQNGIFDASEEIQIGTITNSTGTDGKKAEKQITVPGSALAGSTRMRVIKKYGAYAPPNNSSGYGQAEDYTLVVASGGGPWTVTPSVGTPAGTISPATPQTIADGGTATFTLTPASGYLVASVGGTCGGTLTGTSFVTAPVTADCTVIANFAPAPDIDVSPQRLVEMHLVPPQATARTLTVRNAGDGLLRWTVGEALDTSCSGADVPWLSVAPASGDTAAGESTPVSVGFDSTGLAAGSYDAYLCLDSNDPDPGPGNGTKVVIVPVTLTVEPDANHCAPGTLPRVVFLEDYESGLGSWTTPAGIGANSWALSTSNPHRGSRHVWGSDPAEVSDQRLVSPPLALPAGEDPVVLRFWHVPALEDGAAGVCHDGGILEVGAVGDAEWTQVPAADLLAGSYTGTIPAGGDNPLGGRPAWCGPAVQPYLETVADLSAHAGQLVQLRWRIGSDGAVSRLGWDVDDVVIQSCVSDTLFADGFESGDTANWSDTEP